MPVIRIETVINAPRERCFDLARDIELHEKSAQHTKERAVAGVTKGLIQLGEEVTWEAYHFGVRQRLSVRITAMTYPTHFRDSQIKGAFRRFDHDHYFETLPSGQTRMIDIFDYTSPFGYIGRLADWLFLEAYMRHFLFTRNLLIQQAAEK